MESNELFTKEWFPFEYLKFNGSTSKWRSEAIGAYLLLLIDQWANGTIPHDIDEQLTVAKCDKKVLSKVLTKFYIDEKGNYVNAKLEKVRAEQHAKYIGVVKKTNSANEARRLKKLNAEVNAEQTPSERLANAQHNAETTQKEIELDISKDIVSSASTPPPPAPVSKKIVSKKLFVPPAKWEEVGNYMREYLKEKGLIWARELIAQEAEKYFNHYTANGWKVGGRGAMKDWKAAARNWISNVGQFSKDNSQGGATGPIVPTTPPTPKTPVSNNDLQQEAAKILGA